MMVDLPVPLAPTKPTWIRRDQPVGVLEQELVAIALAGAGELDHGVSI